jgi:phosphohistidine swiveling domain-containing protein
MCQPWMRGVCLLGSLVMTAAEITLVAEKTDKGIVASVSVGKLVMTDSEGKNEHAYVIPMEAKVTLNTAEAKLTDLQKGDAVTVSMGAEGEVLTVAATRTKKPAHPGIGSGRELRGNKVHAAP